MFAPLWVLERAITSWLALYEGVRYGGVRYAGDIVPLAAHSRRALARRSSSG